MRGRGGAIVPQKPHQPKRARKIFLNVSRNKCSDGKLIFIFRYPRIYAFDITQHAPLSFWETSSPDPQRGLCPMHTAYPWGTAQPPCPRSAFPQHELLDPPLADAAVIRRPLKI